jgi:pimeloyl-ACP methyl ester carboxylesterase
MFFFQLPWLPEFVFQANDFAVLAGSLRGSTAHPGIFDDADLVQYKNAWRQPGAPTAMLNYYRANLKRSGSTAKLDRPTLFIYGEKDKAILPETVAGVGDLVSGPYFEHRIPDSGHWVQQEAADEVTRVLREFLDG